MSSEFDYEEEILEEENTDEGKNEVEEIITKKGMSFMSKCVLFSMGFIVLYVIWTQVAEIVWKITPNDILTEWVFKFFGIEIALMCLKKIMDKRFIHKKKKK